jgi:hypothetical protein
MKLPLKFSILAFCLAALPFISQASEPGLDAICKTWTGLDKSSKPKFLYQIQIELEPALEDTVEQETSELKESRSRSAE